MFSGSKFLAYTQKPSVYYLRKLMPESERQALIKRISDNRSGLRISPSNITYQSAYQTALKQYESEQQKYVDSFLWSPRFTPNNFLFQVLPVFLFAFGFVLYHRYVIMPKILMQQKKKYGIRFEQSQKLGYLDGWYEQYIKKDKVLQFEAYTLQDMDRLYKEGMLTKNPEQTIKTIEKKKKKFIRGNKQFITKQFNSN